VTVIKSELPISQTELQAMTESEKIIFGLEETYRRLITSQKKNNSPMIIMKDGKVTAVDPHDMPATMIYERGEGKQMHPSRLSV
jgi:hypothetical protein